MTSAKCLCCGNCRLLGIIVSVIHIVLSLVLFGIGPICYVEYCTSVSYGSLPHGPSYTTCYRDYYVVDTVLAGAALAFLGGALLLAGLLCKNVCMLRFYITSTVLVAIALITCGSVGLTDDLNVGLACVLFITSFWFILTTAFIAKYGLAMIHTPRPPAPVATISTTVSPPPRVIVQPTVQNNIITQTPYTPNPHYQQLPPQQYPNYNHPHPYTPSPYNPNYAPSNQFVPNPYNPNYAPSNHFVPNPYNPNHAPSNRSAQALPPGPYTMNPQTHLQSPGYNAINPHQGSIYSAPPPGNSAYNAHPRTPPYAPY